MKPVIFGLEGFVLTPLERDFFKQCRPTGFILFARNIADPDQVKALTASLRALCFEAEGRADCPILIDQEGGRVQRLKPPHWRAYRAMGDIGRLALKERASAEALLKQHGLLIADDLRQLGINVDCLPVLDVPIDGADNIIGDRAFGKDAKLVADMGALLVESLELGGVLPVIKHIPGHGRALLDSHEALPIVKAGRDLLRAQDFMPFARLKKAAFAMTAHIRYDAYDALEPATFSKSMIHDVIRGEIGFEGLLMSDDLSMKALGGAMAERAQKAYAAGCDLILHCNGEMAEMRAIAEALPEAPTQLRANIDAHLTRIAQANPIQRAQIEADYDQLWQNIDRL